MPPYKFGKYPDGFTAQQTLEDLTKGGLKPTDIPELRSISKMIFTNGCNEIIIGPALDAVEAADKAALYALAALGDRKAVLELGHFGNMTTAEAIAMLKKFRARPED